MKNVSSFAILPKIIKGKYLIIFSVLFSLILSIVLVQREESVLRGEFLVEMALVGFPNQSLKSATFSEILTHVEVYEDLEAIVLSRFKAVNIAPKKPGSRMMRIIIEGHNRLDVETRAQNIIAFIVDRSKVKGEFYGKIGGVILPLVVHSEISYHDAVLINKKTRTVVVSSFIGFLIGVFCSLLLYKRLG